MSKRSGVQEAWFRIAINTQLEWAFIKYQRLTRCRVILEVVILRVRAPMGADDNGSRFSEFVESIECI